MVTLVHFFLNFFILTALYMNRHLSWAERSSTLHPCVFEHICYLINWLGQAHWDFGSRIRPITESTIPDKARMPPSPIAANVS